MSDPVSDEFLERRVKALHNRLETLRLSASGLEATAGRLKQSLGRGTVSVVETTVNGKAIRIVTTNNSSYYKLLRENPKTLLLPGEILGSRPTLVYGPKEPKKRPPTQSIHAEQLGVNDAVKMGATRGRIATSNPGCEKQCVALLTEEFPSFRHVNPSRTAPDPTITSEAVISNATGSPGPNVSTGLSTPSTISGKPDIRERMTSASYLDSEPTGAMKSADQVGGQPVTHKGAHVMPHPAATKQAAGVARYGLRATIGMKAWKAVRIAVFCFVPLTVLDVVIEVAFALWDREREKEERKRREKQKALEAVFKLENNITAGQFRFDKQLKEETKVQSLIQSKILNNTSLFDEFVQDWNNKRNFMGFLYARVNAELHIEVYRDLMTSQNVEALTTYTVTSLDVHSTSWAHNFDWTEIGEEEEVEKTKSDIKRLAENGVLYPEFFKKIVKRKRLKYTLVPPLFTPFDIVVTKINNLFLDMVIFIDSFHGTGGIANFTGFNYKCSWDEQFSVALEFPPPLKESVCRYCLSYLHWAAGTLSRHPLGKQDLEGNLEDPRRGWRRRSGLLMTLLEARDTRYKKNFWFLVGNIKELVKGSGKSEEVVSALEELYMGARAIWYDLERIEANIYKPQYYYFGPSYSYKEHA